jgi:hypothetical protein
MNTFLINNLEYVDRVRAQMNENQLMLCYRGEMSQEIIMALLNLTEKKLNQVTSDSTIKRRVFNVMVECLQNITMHSEKSEHVKSNVFMIGFADSGYSIYSGNVIRRDKVEGLTKKILEINTMSEDDLKELYKYLINNETLTEKSGSGLGLVQIARKTGNPLDFDFQEVDNDYHFFSLKTVVDH